MPQKIPGTKPRREPASPANVPPEFAPFIDLIRRVARDEVQAVRAGDADPWIPHRDWPFPKATRHAQRIVGARKVGRVWLCRRSALDSYITQHAPAHRDMKPANDATPKDALDADLERLGFGVQRRASR